MRNKTRYRKKILVLTIGCVLILVSLTIRLLYIMLWQAEYYTQKADELHTRERRIKAKRGRIIDVNGKILADNQTVCNISVIHNQINDKETVIRVLCEELNLSKEFVKKRVNKISSIEKIKSNVDKEIGDRLRKYRLSGVKIDEDYKRYYPYQTLASKVLGFTGGDNQGIIGLEVKYDDVLMGDKGTILTYTDARGIEVTKKGEQRIEPLAGSDLHISLDSNIQEYATQLARQAMATKEADKVCIIVMNPQDGQIMAMVDVPEFDLNDPYTLMIDTSGMSEKEKQDALNRMWRNGCINDTYEPGSIFKIITASAGLEEGVVTLEDRFSCPGFIIVEDRKIRCHKIGGHGSESFLEGAMNSCNPVFISVGLRLGTDNFYKYLNRFGVMNKTGVDLPGEAGTIIHKKENVGLVELATVSFGQSFQITPIQLAATVSSLVNGGKRITPHLAIKAVNREKGITKDYDFPKQDGILSEETSQTLCYALGQVVESGTGKNGYVEGYHVGGKTATSETLPRGRGKYISSFLGFAPYDNPQILAIAIIYNPKGTYYGGTIAAPVVRQLFENILPYLEGKDYNGQSKKKM